jgi:CYTH domain-containing protein/predicted ATPase
MEEQKIFKIVLTGGPCSGKTTSMSHISDRLRSLGFNVYVVPEAATLMILGGVSLLQGDVVSNQWNLIRLQKQLEQTFIYSALQSDRPSLIICDRGLMDNRAFLSETQWQDLFATLEETSVVELRDSRYDAVIHLITAADGAPEFYTLTNNAARSESLEQAIILDKKLQDVWLGHPHLRVIDNSTDFEEKVRRVVAAICNVVGVPEPIERERKFLINRDSLAVLPIRHETVDIEQTYLESSAFKDNTRIRKRGQHNYFTYTQTIKTKIGSGKNIEKQRNLSEKEFLKLLESANPFHNTIKKKRSCFLWENQYFELDYFLSPNSGLWLLEAELETDGQNVKLPPFLDVEKEVTDDPNYSNYEISKR